MWKRVSGDLAIFARMTFIVGMLVVLFGTFGVGAVYVNPGLAAGTVAVLLAIGVPLWLRDRRLRRRWAEDARDDVEGAP